MKYYAVTSVDTGKTGYYSEVAASRLFGKAEWREIKAGYLPHLFVVEVTKEEYEGLRGEK